jgi:hypothetical protein
MTHFPQQRDRLQPPETFFDALPLSLADGILATSPRKLSIVRGDLDFPSKSDALLRSMSTLPKTASDRVADSTSQVLTAQSAAAPSSMERWWTIADLTVLGVYSTLVFWTIQYHEKWADEAQAWLIARDLDLRTIWFHELRYEGSPGLWHTILWVAQHVFHARYGALSFLGASCAVAGVVALLFVSPFPRPIRWLMALSYFFIYQYAVIARSYVLFPLFCLVAARQFRDLRRPQLFALTLVPLANLTAHGSLMAFGLALAYAFRFATQWSQHDDKTRKWFLISAVGLVLMYLFLFVILLPAADVEATHHSDLTASVIPFRSFESISGALVDNKWMSVGVLCIFAAWCFLRRALTSFLLPVALMVGLYVYANGWPHQQGTIFLAIITGLAIAWPSENERHGFDSRALWAYRVVVATLAAMLCYQAYVASITIRNEVRLPYSGAEDMAKYLEPLVVQGKVICGYQYGMVGINAYFNHNIFANLHRAYYHHALSEFDPGTVFHQIRASGADYIVLQWLDSPDGTKFKQGLQVPMAKWGYSLDHVSDGYMLTKAGYTYRQIYLAFRKSTPGEGNARSQFDPDK